ncbi:MAG: MTH1187 family thiamine-binding protein [Bacteroidales bacterium]|nr:MTH1187 family thiamine-binding protein [Bacteroidales bacterium]
MSVLMEFSMFPTDKGESVSSYVSRIIAWLKQKNCHFQLTPMGTIIETDDIQEALKLVEEAYRLLEHDCNRVYSTIKLDIRKGMSGRMEQKIKSVYDHLNLSQSQ